jgi:DNA (cytosine-5)-methyltransferase 1
MPAAKQKFKIIDLFCKAGGASYGMFWVDPLHIEITGVDIDPQPRYPFKFIQSDFRDVDLSGYDFTWASPPCPFHSKATKPEFKKNHSDLIPQVRTKLIDSKIPFTIEGVPSSKSLPVNLKLRGEMFKIPYRKERWFETSFFILSPGQKRISPEFTLDGERYSKDCKHLIGVDWMNYNEYKNAVPPEYSYYILKSYLEQIAIKT